MRAKYLFSSRRTGRIGNMTRERAKYPEVARKIVDTSDIILEVLDARFYEETRNKKLEEEIERQKKKIIYVLNKSDLATKGKLEQIKANLYPYAIVSCAKRTGIKKLRDLIKITAKRIEKKEKREIKKNKIVISESEKIKVGIIGYPNTGKSSLINILSGRSGAGVGSEAGFTKNVQKIRLSEDVVLTDSPGVIPEDEYSSFDKEKITRSTIFGGKSYSQIKEPELMIGELFKRYKIILEKFYQLKAENAEEFVEKVGIKKNFLKKGGFVNEDKTAREILRAWQKGEIKN
ncbi:MAG: 50S ribosome-binding GTPase [Nanoarchaeota archaeon]|nr:50S ribosome-binding GTPase [Nanoarchaeota archaeon]